MLAADRFKGRSAIGTGGAAGIGIEIATRLAAEGAQVSLWDISATALEAAQIRSGAAHTRQLDIADPDAVAAAMTAALAGLGGSLDVLVASADITGSITSVRDYPVDAWQQVIDVNLNGLSYCNKFAVPHLERDGYGRVVNITSVAEKEGNPNASAYSASKAGVIGFTKSPGKKLANSEIRVNCVTPAAVRTAIFDQMIQTHIDFMQSQIPIGRFGGIDEVTSLVCWLASEEASFSTGAMFDISGGRATH